MGESAARYADRHLPPRARVAAAPSGAGVREVRVLFQGDVAPGTACLTFDDGPDERWTPRVLAMLDRLAVPATFFVLGKAVRSLPELVREETASGHEVGIHHWEHVDVTTAEPKELGSAIDRTIDAIQAAGAPAPRIWRPPYGRVDAPALMVAAERDLDLVLWSLSTPSAAKARAVASTAHEGSVILSHDGRREPSEGMFRELEGSVRRLLDDGIRFVTASQMLDEPVAAAG